MTPHFKYILQLLALPVLLAAALSFIYVLPERGSIVESSLSMDLPVGYDLPGWVGVKRQESERERMILAPDTRFSKAIYRNPSLGSKAPLFDSHVSIILSGSDMNSSIHRPEFCLPSQGHFNLKSEPVTLTLSNGRKVTLTKLYSQFNNSADPKKPELIDCINYYVFVGKGVMTHTHGMRVLLDMNRRVFKGQDQRWAYIQVGVFYGNLLGTTRQEAETQCESLIQALLPRIIKWDELDA